MTLHTNEGERLLLMGCGGVGGVIAGGLLQGGRDPTSVTRHEKIRRANSANGLRVVTQEGEWSAPATVYTHLDEIEGTFDVVCLAMKGTDVEQAARDVESRLSPEGHVVTFQNGVVEDRVSAILGRERVIGALVGWGATMHAPGVSEMTSHGEIIIGEMDGQLTPRVRQLKATLESIGPVTISNNIYGVLWSKLTLNCATSATGAVTGQLLGEMLRRNCGRRLALAIMSEAIDVAEALGISLEPVGGTLDVHQLYLPPERRGGGWGLDLVLKHAIMLVVGAKFRRLKSSMLQSIERGRPAEVDFLNGYVVERGQEKGVPTPVNAALTALVREVEAGTREINPHNLEELVCS